MRERALNRLLRSSALLLFGLFLSGFSADYVGTEQGYYSVNAEFLSSPVRTGMNSMKLVIKDADSNRPVKKHLDIQVIPWMPAHEHPSMQVPAIKEIANGEYFIEGLDFSMPGDWEIYVRITDDGREDTAVFNVTVTE